MRKGKIVTFFLILIIFISGWLYKDSFNAYFFQDDWFTLRISNAQNIQDFLAFFIPRKDVVYYRPIGMQVPFFIISSIFGINPQPFHLLMYLTHTINIILLYILIQKLSDNKVIATISAFLYGTSTIHYIPFYWPSTYAFPLGVTYCLISFLLYLNYSKTGRCIYLFGSIIAGFFALMTNEMGLLLPVIVAIYMYIWRKLNKKYLILALTLPMLYVILRFLFMPDLADTYAIEFGKKTVKALFVYILWLFNWPEEMRNQLENIFVGNLSYILYFKNIFVSGIITLGTSLIILIIFRLKKRLLKEDIRFMRFFLILTVIGLIPLLLFPNHTYPYYLLFSSMGLYALLSMAIYYLMLQKLSTRRLLLLSIFLGMWLINSYITIKFQNNNHWSIQRARISQLVTGDIMRRYPKLNSNNAIYLTNDPYLKVVLSGSDAFHVLYDNSNINVIYSGKEDIIWKNASNDNLIIQNQRLRYNYVL